MSSITPTNALSNAVTSDYNSLLGAATGANSTSFNSIFSQAMSAATTPGQKAQVDFAEAQMSNLNILSAMADPSSSDTDDFSSLASLAASLGGGSSPAAIPSWETDLANLLGPNSDAAQALSVDQQASLASQSLLNNDLNSLGSSIDSVM
jgi:hypothetical protein